MLKLGWRCNAQKRPRGIFPSVLYMQYRWRVERWLRKHLPVSVTWHIRASLFFALLWVPNIIRYRNMSLDSEVRKRTDMNEKIASEQDGLLISSENTMTSTTSAQNNRKWLILNTHLNAVLYSSCFWVQIGVLPVSQGFVCK